jgi:catechol 2,3-dioxygenase-like lactoylglutathione lyase family enzyme
MHISRVHHVAIIVPPHLVEKVRDFYVNALGLVQGERPLVDNAPPGYWLYSGETPVLHLGTYRAEDPRMQGDHTNAVSHLDHVAFTMCERLKQHNVPFHFRRVPALPAWLPLTQIYVRDPAGTYLELAFHNELPKEEGRNIGVYGLRVEQAAAGN